MSHLLIIGGSDAGISAALRIRELDDRAEVTVVTADAYPAFSICGLPFFFSGEVPDWRSLAHHTPDEFEKQGLRMLLDHKTDMIDAANKQVRVTSPDGQSRDIAYDKLLIATGAASTRPPITGLDREGVFLLRFMTDGLAMQQYIERNNPRQAIIIGGGYIGLEMAEALSRRGLRVTVLEFLPEILSTLDPLLGGLMRESLASHGVDVFTGCGVKSIERKDDALYVRDTTGKTFKTDIVLVATGVRPVTTLAGTAGIVLGVAGAIHVDRFMNTGIPDILAAGDCVETWHHLLQTSVYMPLGTTAHKQGRIAGENMVGGHREFPGVLGTQVVKVFDLVAAGTGLRDVTASKAGFDPLTVTLTTPDRNPYYPGAREMHICITGDRSTGRLLGAQIIGHRESEVAKRIDIVAAALYHDSPVEALVDLDLSYTPPLSSPWDPVQKAAMQWNLKRA